MALPSACTLCPKDELGASESGHAAASAQPRPHQHPALYLLSRELRNCQGSFDSLPQRKDEAQREGAGSTEAMGF